jgi:2-(1,2-epoxy-1,2-dihydrophenyl)acetyl-CoA isomerase
MKLEHLAYEVDAEAHTALITLNRPQKLNAIDVTMHQEILGLCEEVQQNEDVWTIIWTGAGRGFCSGADVADGPKFIPDENTPLNDLLFEGTWVSRQADALYAIDKPMIAAVNGVAAGAGFALTLLCDIRVGSEDARFVTVFQERNLPPECGMSYLLPMIVGMGRAMDLSLTSRRVEADEAFRIGLLDRLVPPDQLIPAARELAQGINRLPPSAVRITKRSIRYSMERGFDAANQYEAKAGALTRRAQKDTEESSLSFQEKRAPKYIGR